MRYVTAALLIIALSACNDGSTTALTNPQPIGMEGWEIVGSSVAETIGCDACGCTLYVKYINGHNVYWSICYHNSYSSSITK